VAMNPFPRGALAACLVTAVLGLTGCSTLKSWFTAEGHKFSQGRDLLEQGHPLGATALAVEALVLEPTYAEARELLVQNFAAGQEEFRTATARWLGSKDPARWDRLVELYRWQEILAAEGPSLGTVTTPQTGISLEVSVPSVKTDLRDASLQAAQWHLARAQMLLAERDGPRQARVALAEGRVAQGFAPDAPGLDEWVQAATEKATQRLLVVPFFFESGWRLGAASGPLASEISRHLLEDRGLPELTTVFPADRLITLPGGGPARIGLVSQPDALALAAEAGQNLVLLGQITQSTYLEPRKTIRTETRERTVRLVSPDHPEGVAKVLKAVVSYVTWTTSVQVSASFTVVEVATGRDLVTAVRRGQASDQLLTSSFTGDRDALTAEDLTSLGTRDSLDDPVLLRDRALGALAAEVASVVRTTLR